MKFIKWILNGLAGVFIIFGAGILLLRFAGICPYAVLSGSMEPEIATGGMVFTDTAKRQPHEGDIITYHLNDAMVTHRVIRQENGCYITKGDANQGEDSIPVLPSQIVGTVCFSLPVLGFVVSYLQEWTVILLMIAVSVSSFLLESRPVLERRPSTEKKKRRVRKRDARENNVKIKKKIVKAAAICCAVSALAAGSTMAYLTDYDKTVNEFTVGKVDIELLEPNWKPEDNTKVEPSQQIRKDPQVKNIGKNDAFVYLEVTIPTADVITADAAGNRIDKKNTELFTFTKKADWTQIEAKTSGKNRVYTFAYNKILKPNQTSTTLFDTVTFANIIEGQLDTQQFTVPVRAYAIQTVNTGGDAGTVSQQAVAAYQKYVQQNNGQAGGVTK